ncbi:unnamed protein product, partial [Urochloa humidicola]
VVVAAAAAGDLSRVGAVWGSALICSAEKGGSQSMGRELA